MASSFLKMAANPSTHFAVTNPSGAQLAPREVRPFQVKCKADSEHETPKALSVSRRDTMLSLTALSVTGIAMSSPETAEARISKAEMKRKIREKLEQLREKAGLSKKDGTDKGKGKGKSPPPSTKKESTLPLETAPFPLPNPPQSKSVVEATLL